MIENQIKTVILLGALSGLLLWVGDLLGGMQGLSIAIVFVLGMNLASYFFSDKIVLKMYRAQEVPKSHKLYSMVTELARSAKLPTPKVYIIPSGNPNAFATGRNPKHSAVACTEGILDLLTDAELKGVLAHELSHIKNRDTLIQTIAASIAGIISYVAMMARWAALFGGFGGRDDRGGNGIELLVLAIVTPLVATIIQLAISRSREYMADESGAKISHNPHGLASALEKIHHESSRNPMRFGNPSTSSLFITNPFKANTLVRLLSTHPPMEERVKRLRAMH
ncbi:MAG: zinc metalloprotease HtpX [Candidatus Woesearchaeota archaeon]